ncbi:MAG: c-type cytochrome [Enterobacterales bacterium]|nr:c-type cytochrome [Enterobacterales bacterium]
MFVIMMLSACGGGGEPSEVTTPAQSVVITNDVATTTLKDGSVVETAALVALGDLLYHDQNLSTPAGQSCASCHLQTAGFADPNQNNPTSIGADSINFGTRNSPTASYSAHIPEFQTVQRVPVAGGQPQATFIGGLFWDGRANDLEEQAMGPFLNPVEMANPDEATVIDKVRNSAYAGDFEALFGANILNDSARSYEYVADAIAAFERTELFSPFNSTFDQVLAGTAVLTQQERRGQNIFNGRAQCARCHLAQPDEVELFTDFQYHNIGVPSNPLLPALMNDSTFVDLGLGAVTGNAQDDGKFRTPTLRNIALTAPYMHNGVFTTLREVIEFYNTRDTTFNNLPEVPRNVNDALNIGELGLSEQDIDDLIAFMSLLSDQ